MLQINDRVIVVNGPFKGKKGFISRLKDFNSSTIKPMFVVVFDNPNTHGQIVPECFFDPKGNDLALIKSDSIPDNNQFSEEELNLLRNVIRSYQNMLEMFCVIPAIDNHKAMVNNLANRITNLLLKRAM